MEWWYFWGCSHQSFSPVTGNWFFPGIINSTKNREFCTSNLWVHIYQRSFFRSDLMSVWRFFFVRQLFPSQKTGMIKLPIWGGRERMKHYKWYGKNWPWFRVGAAAVSPAETAGATRWREFLVSQRMTSIDLRGGDLFLPQNYAANIWMFPKIGGGSPQIIHFN